MMIEICLVLIMKIIAKPSLKVLFLFLVIVLFFLFVCSILVHVLVDVNHCCDAISINLLLWKIIKLFIVLVGKEIGYVSVDES